MRLRYNIINFRNFNFIEKFGLKFFLWFFYLLIVLFLNICYNLFNLIISFKGNLRWKMEVLGKSNIMFGNIVFIYIE